MITGTRASSLCSTASIRKVPREDEEEKEKRRERDEEEKEGQQERRESEEMDTLRGTKGKTSAQQGAPQKSPRKRKGFSRKDEDLVADFFAQNIAERRFPTADECRDFIKMYPQFSERRPKDIYDKCRNLAGR